MEMELIMFFKKGKGQVSMYQTPNPKPKSRNTVVLFHNINKDLKDIKISNSILMTPLQGIRKFFKMLNASNHPKIIINEEKQSNEYSC